MKRWSAIIGVLVLILALPVVLSGLRGSDAQPDRPRIHFSESPLHQAAANGKGGNIPAIIEDGASINQQDEQGKTALHHSAANGHLGTTETLLTLGADPAFQDDRGHTPHALALANGHNGTAGVLAASMPVSENVQILNPNLKYPDQASFESAIGQSAIVLKSDHVWLFAPATLDTGAREVHARLIAAYDELYAITGRHTDYIIVVYHFPKGHPDAFGGTSNCTIWYDDTNLRLEQHREWTQHGVPHVSGYIEEMAHNFNYTQFGWEMVGWSIGIQASQRVANNPIFQSSLRSTRNGQRDTFQRYKAAGHLFPSDIPPNQVDRIHAWLLWQCEQEYGDTFWQDFFKEADKERAALASGSRDERYRITIECFDRLPGLNFYDRLRDNGISITTDIKSLNPESPAWNRRLQ